MLAARLSPRRPRPDRGQSLVEFALIVPVLFLLAVAIGDFGRVFDTAVAVESAAREAADYGAFLGSARWDEDDATTMAINDEEMRRRACQAMSQVAGFDDTSGDCTTNPVMTWDVVRPPGVTDCEVRSGLVEPCKIHVRITFQFRPLFALPPIPASISIVRDSTFAVSDLTGT